MIQVHVESSKAELGASAARTGAQQIRAAIADRGRANIVLATGASQFETLAALIGEPDIDWASVTAFHLDEYIGMPDSHPASFRRYLRERFLSHVPQLGAFHMIGGDAADLEAELARLDTLIGECPIDVTFAGIGENAHLAFNDPPADFSASEAFKVMALDERCRRQQLGEGWFPTLADVPSKAVSMTIPQILKSSSIILSVPDRRKAEAVRDTLEGAVSPDVPASVLQEHSACHLFLDPESATLVRPIPKGH